jgi:hypothetical protein
MGKLLPPPKLHVRRGISGRGRRADSSGAEMMGKRVEEQRKESLSQRKTIAFRPPKLYVYFFSNFLSPFPALLSSSFMLLR